MKGFRESVIDAAHKHLVAPKEYTEPSRLEGDGSRTGLGIALLILSAVIVISAAAVAALI